MTEMKRIEKYERDLKRWEFMDDEEQRTRERTDVKRDIFLAGKRNRGGAAYNILNLNYD